MTSDVELKIHKDVLINISYTMPIPKCNVQTHCLSVNNFRGISLSPIISKLLEMAVLDRYFRTSDHQFGLRKHLRYTNAIYCVRNIFQKFVPHGSTVNVCMLDLSKGFDRMNHYALLLKFQLNCEQSLT